MIDGNVQIVKEGLGISETNELDVVDKDIGEVDDVAVTDPTDDATVIAVLKGLLTEINTLNTSITDLNTAIGTTADAAVSTADTNGTLIALTKGVITLNQPV